MVSVLAAGWMGENDLLRAAAAVACAAGHPVAEALLREADVRVVRVVDALNCERRADGAAGVVAGSRILLGSPEYLLDHDVDLSGIPPMEIDWSMLLVAADGRFAGIVRVTPE
jgi:cation transport ATPase